MTAILVVDDREENIDYLGALLRSHGHTVAAARNGAEALTMARAAIPDLIVSDLLMPVMDGYTLLRYWQADPELRDVPFVVYTATYTRREDEELALNLGADAFIVKPAEPAAFIARIRQLLAARTAGSPGTEPLPMKEETALVRQYSAALVRKLEEKSIQLEASNRALEREVAERKVREAEIADITARLERLISEAPVGIIVQKDLKPILVNDRLAAMFGFSSREEILALRDCSVLFVEEDASRARGFSDARMAGQPAPGLYTVKGRKTDGTLIDVENRAFSIPWGGSMAVCGMMTDVTEQNRLEAQLRQSQRLESLGQMTGGVAHDFNNLLTVILGNVELLEESLAGEPRLRRLAEITRTASERAAELTSRLLSFSRQQPLDPKATDIGALLADLEVLVRRSMGEQVELSVVSAPDLWPALADAPQLENALINLAVNARDAMPGGGRLTIATSNAELLDAAGEDAEFVPGAYVVITVSDTGIGMDEATRLRAFDPFFTTKDVGKGSGLGLSMVYGFAKQSQGHVRIASEPGCGTAVTLYLPRAWTSAPRPAQPGERAMPGGSECILVVEDNDLVRDQVIANLSGLGYCVAAARDAIEALALLRRDPDIRLLFTDVVMPRGMNGRQLAAEALRINPDVAILYTSGYSDDALIRDGRLGGAVQLLAKPYRRRDLANKVRLALDRAGGAYTPW